MHTVEQYVLEELKEWQLEITQAIDDIEEILGQSRKQLRINDVKMNIINHSEKRLGHARARIEKHWETYGKPLEEENDRLRREQNEVDSELIEKKRSLLAIKESLEELFGRNEVVQN